MMTGGMQKGLLMIAAAWVLAPAALHAQSLGEVARQARSGRDQPQRRVLTNDDVATPPAPAAAKPAVPAEAPDDAKAQETDSSPATAGEDNKTPAKADAAAEQEAKPDSRAAEDEKDKAAAKKPAKKARLADCEPCPKSADEKEAKPKLTEEENRIGEINKHYIDKINSIHDQIDKAQAEIGRLQRDQLESTAAFRRSSGTNPSNMEYQEQQRVFGEQIEAQRSLINSLGSQLEDAREAARHAGVPHASDY